MDEMRSKNVNNEKRGIEVNEQEENARVQVARKLKSKHVNERLEKVESDLIVNKCEIRKEVKARMRMKPWREE